MVASPERRSTFSLDWNFVRATSTIGGLRSVIAQHGGVRLSYQTKDRHGSPADVTSSSPSLTRPPGSAAAQSNPSEGGIAVSGPCQLCVGLSA